MIDSEIPKWVPFSFYLFIFPITGVKETMSGCSTDRHGRVLGVILVVPDRGTNTLMMHPEKYLL